MRSMIIASLALACLALPAPATEQVAKKALTLETLYSPDKDVRVDFGGARVRGLRWLGADSYLRIDDHQDDEVWQRVDAAKGTATPLYDLGALRKALAAVPGLTAADVAAMSAADSIELSEDARTGLVNHANDLFLVRFAPLEVLRLTFDPTPEVGEEMSPDGRFVAFVRGHDLYLVDIASRRERALTAGGSEELLHGRLDWVYQEEIYGRGNFKGYWWSPDSSRIAYLRLDESPVREFAVVDHLPQRQALEITNYPKAGDPNPSVTLGVVPVAGGETVWVDTTRWATEEHLVVRVGWRPDSSKVVYQVQDRIQTRLELAEADPASGASRVLLRETSPAWVEVLGEPRWLADGGFLWQSDSTGHRHFVRYAADGTAVGAVTSGEWEARDLLAVDEAGSWLYYSSTERDPIGLDVWRVKLDGSGRQLLTERRGTHTAVFDPTATRFLDTWSNLETPSQVRLHAADGRELRVVESNPVPALGEYQWATVERLTIPTRDGYLMDALLFKPADFDPSKRYPVVQHTYGGPYAPVVRDAWDRRGRNLWHHYLATVEGTVVLLADNRSASGKGMNLVWPIHGRMAEGELRDLEDAAGWAAAQPWVDGERIGLWGWSYGGYMTAYALTHSTRWKAGIAGAPVVDWSLYDSIYTERYMKRPQENPEGYAASSVEAAAANLSGALLLIHGTVDDNVHLQQSIRLIYELQKAGKDFEMMLYPTSRHGFVDRDQIYHLQRTMTDFFRRRL